MSSVCNGLSSNSPQALDINNNKYKQNSRNLHHRKIWCKTQNLSLDFFSYILLCLPFWRDDNLKYCHFLWIGKRLMGKLYINLLIYKILLYGFKGNFSTIWELIVILASPDILYKCHLTFSSKFVVIHLIFISLYFICMGVPPISELLMCLAFEGTRRGSWTP